MIQKRVLVVRSPSRTGNIIDFNLDHLFDPVDYARHANLFLLRRRWRWLRLCWLLLWHSLSPSRLPQTQRTQRRTRKVTQSASSLATFAEPFAIFALIKPFIITSLQT